MVFNNNQRFVKLVQNQSLEVSHLLFFKDLLEKSSENFLGDQTFPSFPNASPR